MARRSSLTLETVAYIAIAALALLLRFGNLGGLPLNEGEAAAALPAYRLAQGDAAEIGAQPGYSLLTTILFSILPSSEFIARWWPAVFGLLLVLLPYFWRDVLGRRAALVLALGLALDPGMVAVSRLASGHMLAVAASMMALTAWRSARYGLAGALFGLALLAAPTVYIGVLAFLLVWAFFVDGARPAGAQWRPAAIGAAAMLVLGGTLFLQAPAGLGNMAAPLAEFAAGWARPSGVSALRVLFALAGYGLPALVFGLWGAARAWRDKDRAGQLLSLFAMLALALVLVYPGRQVADLLWTLAPLWALAAQALARYLFVPQEETRAAWGEALLVILLLAFLVLSLARIPANEVLPELTRSYLLIAGGVVALGTLASLLIGLGWSGQAATHGLAWALGLFFALFALAGATRAANPAAARGAELWAPGPAAGQLDLLQDSLADLSKYASGQPGQLSVDVRVPSAALAWQVREFPATPANTAAPLIITLATEAEPAEASAYRGQSFVLSSAPGWQHAPASPIGWLLYRQTPQVHQHIILWAASGLLPQDLSSNTSGDTR
ncbi:MAG: glycosyltransferase family 39 protein [Anaerolineales bacterium]|nr:glycosyltransferase family 39 protein [Anaerolineales bacterium]